MTSATRSATPRSSGARDVAKAQKRVTFSEENAKRIAGATLAYERGNRDKSPVRFRQVPDDWEPVVLAKTVSTWTKGTSQNVTLYEEPSPAGSEQTAAKTRAAFNKLCTVEANRFVFIALASNGNWYLLNWECGESSYSGQKFLMTDG